MKHRVFVETGWYRRIRVHGNRIIIPRCVDSTTIEYVPSMPLLSLLLVIALFTTTSSMLVLVGLPGIWLLVVLSPLILFIDKKLRETKVKLMKRILPEEKVLGIIKKAVSLCRESSEVKVTFMEDDLVVIARCGYPIKCIEYNTSEIYKKSPIYVMVLSLIILFYVLKLTIPLVITSITSILFVILYAGKNVCKKYLVKKERVELKI